MTGSPDTSPLRVAIIGSGPSGFYSAEHIHRGHPEVEVDMFDRLPTPYGLVRGGVAPDHPKIKSVTRVYDKTASHPGFRFYGNVEYGTDITREELQARYHAVVYAVGAQTDRRMNIDGEDLAGSHPATAFVGWYNGHPDYGDVRFDLMCDRAVVVGNGNVAIDVARMLVLSDTELRATDTAHHAIDALAESSVREVVVMGRRGPAQAAFTNPELRELGQLDDVDVIVDPEDLVLDEASQAWLQTPEARATNKNIELLRDYAGRTTGGASRRIVLRFGLSPRRVLGTDAVEAVEVERNDLVADDTGAIRARPTGETELLDAGLVLRSIGYRGLPLPGLPFDDAQGVIPNDRGRVTEDGTPRAREYVVGWIKRGPSGIIGTNKKDAAETVAALFEDLEAGALTAPPEPDRDSLERLLREREVAVVPYEGWELIDAHERELGESEGRPRRKLTRVEEMLEVASARQRSGA